MPQIELAKGEIITTDEHGQGIEFRGAGSRAIVRDVPNISGKEALSISMYFRCDELPDPRDEGSMGAGALLSCDYRMLLRVYSSGQVYGGLTNDKDQLVGIFSNAKIAPGSWHHLVLTFSSADQIMRLYLDGSIVGEAKGSIGKLAALPDSPLVLGSDPDGSDFRGAIADVRLYDYALTQEDIDGLLGN